MNNEQHSGEQLELFPETKVWDSIWELAENIREHAKNNGRSIVNEDDSLKLQLGWRCTTTNKLWLIKLVDFKNSAQLGKPNDPMGVVKGTILLNHFTTQEGKDLITESFNAKD